MKYPFQQLSTTNARYADELKKAAADVIDSGWYLNGLHTRLFEKNLAAVCGTAGAAGCSTGLDAIRLIFRAYMELNRLAPGDKVAVVANTFIATLLPLADLGLKIVCLDPDPVTHCLDWKNVERLLPADIRAIAVTHLYGNPSWDSGVAASLRDRGIMIVEDNAQAIGALWHGIPTGSLGDASAISFYPAKNIGALGDAGAVCTSDPELLETVKALRNYGSDKRYFYPMRGYNCRIDEIQAAFLNVKLRHLDEIIAQRNAAAETYSRTIGNPCITTPARIEGCRQVWHQYVLRTPYRDELAEYLESNDIGTAIHYPVPPHLQPCFKDSLDCTLPVAETLAKEVLSIPIADISAADAHDIALTINRFKPTGL